MLALALFEHVVAGLGEDEAATQSWLEVESLVLSPALRLTGQSKVSLGAQGPGVPGTAGPGRLGTL